MVRPLHHTLTVQGSTMHGTTITYTNNLFETEPVSVDLGPRKLAAVQPGDILLQRMLAIDCPLKLTVVIREDGTAEEKNATWGQGDNTYWHLDFGSREKFERGGRLTEAQRRTLVEVFCRRASLFGLWGGLGGPVMAWVDATPEELEEAAGHKLYFA